MQIKIFQVKYKEDSGELPGADSAIDNIKSDPKYRELPAFLSFVQEKKYDESHYINLVKDHFGTAHHHHIYKYLQVIDLHFQL